MRINQNQNKAWINHINHECAFIILFLEKVKSEGLNDDYSIEKRSNGKIKINWEKQKNIERRLIIIFLLN